jgi:hypothetical protein
VVEVKKAVVEEEVNWLAYFNHIKTVCPWSYAAYKKGEIKIKEWSGVSEDLGNYQAIVYVIPKINRRRLKKLCKKLDTSLKYEWLWSEPTNGVFASPVPILIQQDRRKLFELRFSTGYYNDIIG